jgi:hypothetical protein
MKWQGSLLSLLVLATCSFAQTPDQMITSIDAAPTAFDPVAPPHVPPPGPEHGSPGNMAESDKEFSDFIGFVSNPTVALDPRALTQLWPLFASTWTNKIGPLGSGDMQVYGVGVSIAFSDRFEVGLNKGGYVVAEFNKNRDGWANLGGFAQYTVIRDPEHQFLLSLGLMCEAPTGEAEVGGGHGPVYLTPYLTFGKGFGNFHVLGTTGYNFPCANGTATTHEYYASVHFDYRLFGWFYPLVEFNGWWSRTNVDLSQSFLPNFFSLDRFDIAGNLVTVAPGFNAVLIPDRLEVGMTYQTPIWSQRDVRFDQVLLKIILRF